MQNLKNAEKRIYLLYNPKSGRETIKNSINVIIEAFTKAGYEVIVRPTFGRKEATEIAKNLSDEYDVFVCCGGDGTLNEVVAGALSRDIPLRIGYIPCGSTNDFGNTIYGNQDLIQITNSILKKQIHQIDCGKLEEQPFIYTAAFGLFTEISYETPHSAKAALGHAAYLLEALKNLGNIKARTVRALINDSEIISGNYLIGMVTNADQVGGIQNITGKNVSLNDGELELTMIARPERPSEYGKVLQALTEGKENQNVFRRKIRKVVFEFDEPTAFTVDGEYGGTYTLAEINCLNKAITMYF